MPINFAEIATQTVNTIAPFAPLLLGVGQQISDTIAKEAGKVIFDKAKLLWDKLQTDEGAKVATKVVAKKLGEEDIREELIAVIIERLQENPELAEAIVEILKADESRVQEMLAEEGGKLSDTTQSQRGKGGKQTMKVKGKGSSIKGSKQCIE